MSEVDPFIEHSLRTSMFFEQSRLMIAGNPKAAGTTLRWWLLTAHGIDVAERTKHSWWGESAPYQTVWDEGTDLRYIWPQLSEAERKDAVESDDVLTVLPIRHPVTRLFSSWSGKYLTGEPYYSERLPEAFPSLPDRLTSEREIRDGFTEFVKALHAVVTEQGFEEVDVHLWPQHRLLGRQLIGPSLVLRQESIGDGFDAIAKHLRDRDIEPGSPPRINETVVPYRQDWFSDEAMEQTLELFAGDLVRWNYERELPPDSGRTTDLNWLNDVRGRNARYGVLHRALIRQKRERERAQRELDSAQRRESELVDSTSWKVTGPLRWVSDRTRK